MTAVAKLAKPASTAKEAVNRFLKKIRFNINGVDLVVYPPSDAYEADSFAAVMIHAGIVDYLRVILQLPLVRRCRLTLSNPRWKCLELSA